MFGTPKVVSILSASQSCYADGAFKVAPQQFYQLLVNNTVYGRSRVRYLYERASQSRICAGK